MDSNVAIEFGYAVQKVGDEMILMVQNTHYGSREDLPFDLRFKAGPIQYTLAPGASKDEIAAQKVALVGDLVIALRACLVTLAKAGPGGPKFQEIAPTTNRAVFWQPNEVIAQFGHRTPLGNFRTEDDDVYEYRFDEQRALYLRLIPTKPRGSPFPFTELMRIAEHRRIRVMTRTLNGGTPYRNRYGAIFYEASGTNRTPVALTQLHRNGEIWGVTREYWSEFRGENVIAMGNVENRIIEGLEHFIAVAGAELEIELPYEVEIGIIGVKDMRLSMPRDHPMGGLFNPLSEPIYDKDYCYRWVLNDVSTGIQAGVVRSFIQNLYALAAVDV